MLSSISIFIFVVVVFRAASINVGGTAAGATVGVKALGFWLSVMRWWWWWWWFHIVLFLDNYSIPTIYLN